ncbi:hypothetical protein GCM10022220_13910 [Actinocatenispora rupis]|uniref:Uncharacterized protein n=1 Tax=Actinocatenispora rupis TaxID=519421 RepID=A0A8J3N915_9ACTN|nr:hypothetical protein Aru02nite_15600 [Actinocatenispora rupis]
MIMAIVMVTFRHSPRKTSDKTYFARIGFLPVVCCALGEEVAVGPGRVVPVRRPTTPRHPAPGQP